MLQAIKSLHLKLLKTELGFAMYGLYLFIKNYQLQQKTGNELPSLQLYIVMGIFFQILGLLQVKSRNCGFGLS